jgi:hypothetical protein
MVLLFMLLLLLLLLLLRLLLFNMEGKDVLLVLATEVTVLALEENVR